jgi:hypothetical protein
MCVQVWRQLPSENKSSKFGWQTGKILGMVLHLSHTVLQQERPEAADRALRRA